MDFVKVVLLIVVALAAYHIFVAPLPLGFLQKDNQTGEVVVDEPELPVDVNDTELVNVSGLPYDFEVHFIDVGQGDSILIKYPNDEYMLIDAGRRYKGTTVANYLDDLGVKSIHTVVASHNDADHIGGLIKVFNNFDVQRFLYVDTDCTTLTCEEVMREAEREGSINMVASTSLTYFIDNRTRTQILHPPKALIASGDTNENSVVIKVTYDENSFLFTGDCGFKCEDEMFSTGKNLDVDVLKVAHHGAKTGTSQGFVEATSPYYSIISVGDNSYGHPAKETLTRLIDSRVLRTDELGTIVIKSNGKSFEVVSDE